MHTLSAFYTAAVASAAVDTVINALSDQVVQTRAGRYQFREKRKILAAHAAIGDGTVLKLDYPSALKVCTPIIDPLDADGVGGSLPAMVFYGDRGLVLPEAEDIGCLASRAVVAAADCFVGLWTTSQFTPARQGPTWTIRGTAAIVAATGVWGLGTITLDRPLPKGRYEVVGMRVTGANVLYARLSFYGQIQRPGTIANVTPNAYILPYFRNGFMGKYGEFDNYLLPQLEIVGIGATAAQAISLDIVPIDQ